MSRTRAEPAQGGSARARRGRGRAVRARSVRGDAAVGFPEAAGRGRRAHLDGWRRLRADGGDGGDGGGGGGRGRGVEQPPRDRTEPRRRTCRSARGAARARPPPGAAAEAAEAAGCGRVRQDERRGERAGPALPPPRGPCPGPLPAPRSPAPLPAAPAARPAPTPAPGRVFLPRPGGVRGARAGGGAAGVGRGRAGGPGAGVSGPRFGVRAPGAAYGVLGRDLRPEFWHPRSGSVSRALGRGLGPRPEAGPGALSSGSGSGPLPGAARWAGVCRPGDPSRAPGRRGRENKGGAGSAVGVGARPLLRRTPRVSCPFPGELEVIGVW